MNAVLQCQTRLLRLRGLRMEAMVCAHKGQIASALCLAEEALGQLSKLETYFAPDEQVMDALVATFAVCAELAKRREQSEIASRALALLDDTVRLRVELLVG